MLNQVKRAKLVEIEWNADQSKATKPRNAMEVNFQFNPQTLKLTISNRNAGGEQPGGSTKQHIGATSTKLSVELLFDTSNEGTNVRLLTERVEYFLRPKGKAPRHSTPPGVRFEWGTFLFEGVVDSMDETLDYFSAEGVPLRATVALSLSHQKILAERAGKSNRSEAAIPSRSTPGQQALAVASDGDSIAQVAARNGGSNNWKALASANNIDDPLRLPAGILIEV